MTLQDVAQVAGVTSITVSRYLREPTLVAEETAERIRCALRETGYVPNKQAGQLASGRSNMVAALVPNLAHSIFAETLQGLSDGLQSAGLELLLASTNYSMEREEEQLRAVLGWFPGAVIVTGRHHSHGALRLLHDACAGGTPVVEILDHHPQGEAGFTQVGFSHDAAGRAMALHLLERGHRRLVYVDSGEMQDFRAHERGAGFLSAARESGAQAHLLRAPTGDRYDAGRSMLRVLLAEHADVSAAAFSNDHLACGVLLEAQRRGVAVPGTLALLGFGDFPIGRHLQPPLSTVSTPRHEIGREAAHAVIDALRGRAPVHRELTFQLLARQTT